MSSITQPAGRSVPRYIRRGRESGDAIPPPRPLALTGTLAPALALAASAAALAFACLSLSLNSLDPYRLPIDAALAASLALLLLQVRFVEARWDLELLALLGASLVAFVGLALIPEYTYGNEINAFIHRSFFSAVIMLFVALPALCASLYWVLGATPTARDISRYPLICLPIAFAVAAYGAILVRLVQKGWHNLTWHAVTHAYNAQLTSTEILRSSGMRNHIEGTLLLMGLTALFALPIGVGAGVFISEYRGWLVRVVSLSTSMLRAISVFILAATAFSLVRYSADNATASSGFWHSSPGSWLAEAIQGSYRDPNGFKHAAHGSFLMASVFLSLLVIPVISRSTEEGLRSVPRELRDGSTALGATEGHSLLGILIPWSLPNIITGLLLGVAEAAGSVTVLLFVAGDGQHGVAPLREVTSLAFLVFSAGRGPKSFTGVMSRYQFSAALLLLMITFALTAGALVMKQRFGARYRAGIT